MATTRNGERLAPTSRLWPDEAEGPWLLSFRWQVIDGRAECVGLNITSTVTDREARDLDVEVSIVPRRGQPLKTIVLRDIRLAELLHEERVRHDHLAVAPDQPPKRLYQPPKEMRPATARKLQLVAETYSSARASGAKSANAIVAEKLKVSIGAASNLVNRARDAGFLPPAE